MARRNQALATIVLAIEPYHFSTLSCGRHCLTSSEADMDFNKIRLRKKLLTTRLKEGKSMKEHIKQMTEVCIRRAGCLG